MSNTIRITIARWLSNPSAVRLLMAALALAMAAVAHTDAPIGGGTGV